MIVTVSIFMFRGNWMIRVLVMAESSLLADAIISNLAQDPNLDVLRIGQDHRSKLAEVIREDCAVLIVIEEGNSNYAFITANNLLRDFGCLRMITISSQEHHLHVCDSYDIPISGITQIVNLAKGVGREYRSEVER
jgi:hypothetical protein